MADEKIQIIACVCGGVFAACCEPECYEEVDWQKDMRRYVANGCTVKLIPKGELKFSTCTCPINPRTKEINLQQTLF